MIRTDRLAERTGSFPDTALDGFRVANRFLVGAGAGPATAEVVDNTMYVEVLTCPPGEMLAEHRHPHPEALFVLDGEWDVYWREHETHVVHAEQVGPWDLVWVPPMWWRSALNLTETPAHLLVFAGLTAGCDLPGWLTDRVEKEANTPLLCHDDSALCELGCVYQSCGGGCGTSSFTCGQPRRPRDYVIYGT